MAELEAIIAKLTHELDFWRAYAGELEKVICDKVDKNFDFQELKKKIIAALAKNEPAEVVEEEPSITSPPTSPRKDHEETDSQPSSAPPSPAGVAPSEDDIGLVANSRSMIELQFNLEKVKENMTLKIQDLEEDLKLAKAEREEQRQQLLTQQQELEEAISALAKEREENQMRVQAFEYEIKKSSSVNDEKAETIERAQKDAAAAKEQLEAMRSAKAAVEAERNKFHGFLSQAKADVLRWREEAAKSAVLEDKLVQLAERFQAQDDRRAELESFVIKSQATNETMQLQLDAKEQENSFLADEVQRLRQKLTTQEQQTEQIKEDLHKKLMEKTSQASALSADAAAAAENVRVSSKQLDDAALMAAALADSKRQGIQLQSELAIKDVRIRELKTQLDEMGKEVQRSAGRLDTEKSAISQLEKRFQEVESQLHAQRITKEAIDADLSESQRNASALENQLSVVRLELDRAQRDSSTQIQRMQKQLDQANERVAELESTRDKMYDHNAELKSNLDAAKAQIMHMSMTASLTQTGGDSGRESRSATPVGSLSSSLLSEDSFEDLEVSSKPARGGNIRKPVTKSLSGIGASVKKSGVSNTVSSATSKSPQKPQASAPVPVATPQAAQAASPQPPQDQSPSSSAAGTGRTKKERGFFSRLIGDSGPTKRYVSEVAVKQGSLWTHVGPFNTWKSHTFMLWENNLYGWRSATEMDRDADVTIRVDGCTVKVAETPSKVLGNEGPYQFTLVHPRRQIVMGATSAAEVQAWVVAINELNARGGTYPSTGLTPSSSETNLASSPPTGASVSAALPIPSSTAPIPIAVPDPDVTPNNTPK